MFWSEKVPEIVVPKSFEFDDQKHFWKKVAKMF